MGIASDISVLKTLSDGVVANKVSRFAYTESAYTDNQVNGVPDYDVNRAQNIPVGTPTTMKVNQTVIDKGWRARASSITRMLMNHFLGRVSYNLNKINDWFNDFLVALSNSLGTANGIATLDANGHLIQQSPIGSPFVGVTKGFLGAMFGRLLAREWKQGTGGNTNLVMRFVVYANGLWVCASNANGLWWSEDGKAWTQGTGDNTTYYMQYLVYANGLWVCGSHLHGCWWSEDGKNWTQATGVPKTYYMQDSVYANGLWVCACDGHGMWYSSVDDLIEKGYINLGDVPVVD